MNWPNVLPLTLAALGLLFAVLRVERKRRGLLLMLLVAPTLFLVYRWAAYAGQFAETYTAFGIAAVIAGLWWLFYGRRHPPGSSDNIKVWGQEE